MAFEVGQRVGDYEVVKMLGVGGMGHVYLVRNIISNRTEAMKVLLPDLTAERDLAARFISEIRTLATFDHPNIAQLRTAFQSDNQLIMIMEYVEGSTLEQMAQGRQLGIQEIAGYISQALSALSYAHAHGVVHRDIKPANLMVTSHGIVKLMDFGIAKSANDELQHTRPGTTIGSLHYMSPEQVRGGTIDARSDLYSVGVVLYELTAGRRPFEADTTFSILNQQLNVEPTPPIEYNPQLSPELNQVILTALAKDPLARYQTADDFRNALKTFRTADAPAATSFMPVPVPVPAAATIAPAAAAAASATAATQILGSTPPPAFASVPGTAAPAAPYANTPVAAATPQQIPYSTPIPPPAARSGGHRGLWIAVGALVVILALVGVGFAVPHFVNALAGSRNTTADTTNTATATPPATQPTTPEATTSTPQPIVSNTPVDTTPTTTTATSTQPVTNAPTTGPRYGNQPSAPHTTNNGGGRTQAMNQSVTAQSGPPPAQPESGAGLEAAQDRFIQMRSRADAARHSVQVIRSQNEQSGYGLRGDIEAADSRLGSYLFTANNAITRGDPAAAQRAMDKAEPDLATVEKFLGH